MTPSTKMKVLFTLVGMLTGAVLAGGYGALRLFNAKHHYREINTFFRGKVAGKEVLGISYFDYHGIGFMERNQWKILLKDRDARSIMIYQNRPIFQESIPHQPEIEIKDGKILINDGENHLTIEVRP